MVDVRVMRFDGGEGLELPSYATTGSAGCDLRLASQEPVTLQPGERKVVPTGIGFALPEGYEVQVRPRSGLAVRLGLTVLNAPGTIDADYRGEIKVPLINLGQDPIMLERGERIAQAVLARVEQIRWVPVERLDDTERGAGGFGSTGT